MPIMTSRMMYPYCRKKRNTFPLRRLVASMTRQPSNGGSGMRLNTQKAAEYLTRQDVNAYKNESSRKKGVET